MTHVIRVRDGTFEELTRRGKWQDTMDNIISRVLKQTAHHRTLGREDRQK
jgi:hypothetical protein